MTRPSYPIPPLFRGYLRRLMTLVHLRRLRRNLRRQLCTHSFQLMLEALLMGINFLVAVHKAKLYLRRHPTTLPSLHAMKDDPKAMHKFQLFAM